MRVVTRPIRLVTRVKPSHPRGAAGSELGGAHGLRSRPSQARTARSWIVSGSAGARTQRFYGSAVEIRLAANSLNPLCGPVFQGNVTSTNAAASGQQPLELFRGTAESLEFVI